MARTIHLSGDNLSTKHINDISIGRSRVALSANAKKILKRSQKEYVKFSASAAEESNALSSHTTKEDLINASLHLKRALYSHAVSCGKAVDERSVRAAIVCKINSIISRRQPVRQSTLNAFLHILNRRVTPIVRESDSISIDGYSSALAEIALVIIGDGEAFYRGEPMPGALALKKAQIEPVKLSMYELPFIISGSDLSKGQLALIVYEVEMIIKNLFISLSMGIEPYIDKNISRGRRVVVHEKEEKRLHSAAIIRKLLQKKESHSPALIHFDPAIVPVMEAIEMAVSNVLNTKTAVESMINERIWNDEAISLINKSASFDYHTRSISSLFDTISIVLRDTAIASVDHSRKLINKIRGRKMKVQLSTHYNERFFEQLSSSLSSLALRASILSAASSLCSSDDEGYFLPTGRESSERVAELVSINNSTIAIENLLGYLNLSNMKKKDLARGTSRAYRKIKNVVDSFDYKRPISQEMAKIEQIVRDHSLVESVERTVGPIEIGY